MEKVKMCAYLSIEQNFQYWKLKWVSFKSNVAGCDLFM